MTADEVVNEIVLSSLTGTRLLLANHNLHSLYLTGVDSSVAALYELADRTIIDGAPILWMAKRKSKSLDSGHRVGSTDWLVRLLPEAKEAKLRIAFLGGEPGVAERASRAISERVPGISIETHDGYFDATSGSDENAAVLAWIRSVRPDVLLVGMGMPRQERWVVENYADISATVVCTVGGCLDYVAGVQKLAPRWLGPLGLEWAYRFACDPVRLWRRYIVEPQCIAVRCVAARLRRR